MLTTTVAQSWIVRWDRQQEGYLPDREERFTALIDAVEAGAGRPDPLVLDLGCGPGSLSARLRDTGADPSAAELLNIFVQEGEQLFDAALPIGDGHHVVLGAASVLAEQPEFSAADRMRRLLALTETPQAVGDAIRKRVHPPGISITIGAEHEDHTGLPARRRATGRS